MKRAFDVICTGRAAVDLYGEQIGGRLEDMLTFNKYMGGSPANTAVGVARLGLKPAMLTRVGDEHNGRFVKETLAAEGVDVSHVVTDPKRLTALVFLGIRDRDTFPLVFYRDNCADMAIAQSDFDADFIGSATALLISGTHLSQPQPYETCRAAIRMAKQHGTRVALDIDYRPVLWGLTGPGMGEQRFVPSDQVSAHLQTVIPECDLLVGTEEEIHIAGGSTDTLTALRRLRDLTNGTIVVKRGPMGCAVFDGAIPERIEEGISGPGFPVEVYNVLGAGDAFMAGFLRGWLRDEELTRCCAYANACGALVVSRHGCAPAMPSWEELQFFLKHGATSERVREDAGLEHLHRASTRTRDWPELAVLAFDHRVQFDEIAALHQADQTTQAIRISAFKRLIAAGAKEGAQRDARLGGGMRYGVILDAVEAKKPARRDANAGAGIRYGVILDDRYGEDILPTVTGVGGWVARPVELPGSRPLQFEAATPPALTLRAWPGEHIAKCLVAWHPHDPAELRARQIDTLRELQQACIATFHELLIEVIPPRDMPADDNTLAEALEQLYAARIRPEWWKLPPAASGAAWNAITRTIQTHDMHCRGVLMLGLEASEAELKRSFAIAAPHPICKGFAVGRSIFADAAAAWFAGSITDEAVVEDIATRYTRLIALWRAARTAAKPARAVQAAA